MKDARLRHLAAYGIGLALIGAPGAALAATSSSIPVSLGSAYNADGVANPAQATDNHTSWDTGGGLWAASTWPSSGIVTTTTFTQNDGSTVKGTQVTFDLAKPSNTAFDILQNAGQTVTVPSGNYQAIDLLGNVPFPPVSFNLILKYSDGSTGQVSAAWPGWFGPADAKAAVATGQVWAQGGSKSLGTVGLYAFSYPVDSSKTLTAVTLPSGPSAANPHFVIDVAAMSLIPAAQAATGSQGSSTKGATPPSSSGSTTSLPKTGSGPLPLVGGLLALGAGAWMLARRRRTT